MLLLILNFAGKFLAWLLGLDAPVAALALWSVPDFLLAYHVFAARGQGLLRVYRRFHTSHREVWLTLDDGPDPVDTPRILEVLTLYDARATFFVIGELAAAHPALIRSIVEAGHEIGHHTQTHPLGSFWCASPRRLGRELDEGLATLKDVAGVTPTRFRPPAGHKNLWLRGALRSRGMVCIGWSARGLERWYNRPEPVAARVMRRLSPGAILLLHEGPRVPGAIRVRALEVTLEFLAAKGYRCVIPTLAQLQERRSTLAERDAKNIHPTTPPRGAPATASRTTC